MIGIIDCDLGNLRSVANALDSLGQDVRVLREPACDDLTHLILPGVGSYFHAAGQLRERGFTEAIRAFAASGRPLLGICLGMQLLSTSGEEGGAGQGLGLVPGRVVRFDSDRVPTIPHVGWNGVAFARSHPVLRKVKTGVDFYFVHSYHLVPDQAEHVLGRTEYGAPFTSVVAKDNVLGFQFHPEKSQANGLRLLENFCDWDGTC
jgi:glutamine amidotransferase